MKDRPKLESLDPDLDPTFPKSEGEVRFGVWSKAYLSNTAKYSG